MPRSISRVGPNNRRRAEQPHEEEIDGVIMGDMGDAYSMSSYEMPPDFDFPENIKDMSWEEREALYRRHVRHHATAPSSDVSPSAILDPDVPRPVAPSPDHDEPCPLSGDIRFDEEHGYVVSGEDEGVIAGRLSSEALEEFRKTARMAKSRRISPSEAHAKKMAALPRLEREAEERFGNL